MADFDLQSMNKEELQALQKNVAKAISGFDERMKAEALAKAEAAVKEFGYSLADLTGGKRGGKMNPPKYRNPADPSKTWTGRGRQPQWIKDALAAGKDLSEMAI